jgi:hypothetical protein
MNTSREERIDRILRQQLEAFGLDLGGLAVFTEAATGPYLYTPVLAALAGARKVYAVAADSRYAAKEEVRERTAEAARRFGVAGLVEVVFGKRAEAVGDSDIITNTGFVRPIDREMVAAMKPTAVVPLMWETWEFRKGEVDLRACRERGILVLGTDESKPPHAIYPYTGYIAMKLLFELGLEGYKTKTLLLGGGAAFGRSIRDHFRRLGMEVDWFSGRGGGGEPYERLAEHFAARGATYDALIVAEHSEPVRLLGEGGLLSYDEIRGKNPAIRIGVIAGNVDGEGLKSSGLAHFPEKIEPFGYMSYQSHHLGPRPILELYAAGLKVGEAMARARLRGATPREAAAYALEHSPAMDFDGDRGWLWTND